MGISELRQEYHRRVCNEIIRIEHSGDSGDYPNFADGSSVSSKTYAWSLLSRISCGRSFRNLRSPTTGTLFEQVTNDFVNNALHYASHMGSNDEYFVRRSTARLDQHEHLSLVIRAHNREPTFASTAESDYSVQPNMDARKKPTVDGAIDETSVSKGEVSDRPKYAILSEQDTRHQTLHAIITYVWTIRADPTNNTVADVANLVMRRKGHLPQIVAITAEPWPARIAALALGTGDLDCVYHFALPELVDAVNEAGNEDATESLQIMINGKRLRDISDLPFDLAI
jgi:hypothetical protein